MSKTIVTSLLPALAVAITLNLHAAPAWTTEDVAPEVWTALAGNLLDGLTGTKTGTISTGYGTTDMGVLTDGVVPTVNGNETRVAFQNTGAVEWFDIHTHFDQRRLRETLRLGHLDGS